MRRKLGVCMVPKIPIQDMWIRVKAVPSARDYGNELTVKPFSQARYRVFYGGMLDAEVSQSTETATRLG
jgi:hypothetical protein